MHNIYKNIQIMTFPRDKLIYQLRHPFNSFLKCKVFIFVHKMSAHVKFGASFG